MPYISLEEAEFPKVYHCPVDALVLRSSERWREAKYHVHFFHFFSAAGFPSHYGRSLGKEFTVRIEIVAKAARGLPKKGRPARSAFFCTYSTALIYSGTRRSLVLKDGRLRRRVMTS